MLYQKIYETAKTAVKNTMIAYMVFGTLYMLGSDVTGHLSADLHQGKVQLNQLEKTLYTPLFDKIGIESDLLKN